MLSISSFQFFVSFCCVFIKFDTKFDRATLLEISFLHFRNTSLLHTLTQHAVKWEELMLASWNLHWSSSKNICLGWCLSCGYSFARCRATHSVSLLSWRTAYSSACKVGFIHFLQYARYTQYQKGISNPGRKYVSSRFASHPPPPLSTLFRNKFSNALSFFVLYWQLLCCDECLVYW